MHINAKQWNDLISRLTYTLQSIHCLLSNMKLGTGSRFEVQYSVILSSVSLLWPLRPGWPKQHYWSTLEDIQNHVLKGHPGTIRKRGPQPPFYSHYRVFPVLSLYASTRCPPVWPLRPGGTSHQFSSTLEDIQNHVLKSIRFVGGLRPPLLYCARMTF